VGGTGEVLLNPQNQVALELKPVAAKSDMGGAERGVRRVQGGGGSGGARDEPPAQPASGCGESAGTGWISRDHISLS
jgi:hypothetical protein